jgi:hypothetical protein
MAQNIQLSELAQLLSVNTASNTILFSGSISSKSINVNGAISLSGSNGTAGYVLTSNGSSNAYWGLALDPSAQYTWTNTQLYTNTVTLNASLLANTVNAASHTVGTSFIANSIGVYSTGIVNAASHTVGTSFIANLTQLTLTSNVSVNGAIFLRGSNGTPGQVLTSNGTGNAYWSTPSILTASYVYFIGLTV